jgi:hypothetical protein
LVYLYQARNLKLTGNPEVFDSEMNNIAQVRARHAGGVPDSTGQIPNAPPPPDSAMSAALRYTRPAQEAGVADRQFALRLQPTSEREGDYIIHLKQR